MLRLNRVDEKAQDAMVEICKGYVDEAQDLCGEIHEAGLELSWKDSEALSDMRARALTLAGLMDKALRVSLRLRGEVR